MHVNLVRTLIVGALILSFALARAEDKKDYVWTDSLGLSVASPCRETTIPLDKMPFRVVIPDKEGNTQFLQVRGKAAVRLPRESLVVRTQGDGPTLSPANVVRVVSPAKGPDSQRGIVGNMSSSGLARLSDQILYTMNIPAQALRLDRTFWMLEVEDGAAKAFMCPKRDNQPFFIFNVYLRDGSRSVIRVGVSATETAILSKSIVVRSVQEALDLDSNLVTQFMGIFGFNKDGEANKDDDDEGEGGEGGEPGPDNPSIPTPLVDGPISGPINQLFHGNGEHSHIACKDKDGINVRDDSLETIMFETGRFERIFLLQGFGSPIRRKHIVKKDNYEEEFTFVKVQLPDRPAKTGEAVTGWVAENGISLEANCKPFQDSLKNVVCMGEGSIEMRDSNHGKMGIRINAGEAVLLRSDWATTRERWTIDSVEHDFVPVMIPSLSLKEGWMAMTYLKPEPVCKAEAEGSPLSSEGLNDPKCCNFPLNQPSQYHYTKRGDGTDGRLGRYFGAPRRNKTRLHAGVDLFAPRGTSVYAVADGTVLAKPHDFTKSGTVWTQVMEVKHKGGYIVRYGEVDYKRGEFDAGSRVATGQKLGKVSRTVMLHLEMYDGSGSGAFYVAPTAKQIKNKTPVYERRGDLMNPFPYVHKWEVKKFGSKAP